MQSESRTAVVQPKLCMTWKFVRGKSDVAITRNGAPLLYAREATSFLSRLRGLHAIGKLEPTEALLLTPCKAIHTFGLKWGVEVAFIDRNGVILKIDTVSPGSVSACLRAHAVIEMAPGTISRIKLLVGQVLQPVARP